MAGNNSSIEDSMPVDSINGDMPHKLSRSERRRARARANTTLGETVVPAPEPEAEATLVVDRAAASSKDLHLESAPANQDAMLVKVRDDGIARPPPTGFVPISPARRFISVDAILQLEQCYPMALPVTDMSQNETHLQQLQLVEQQAALDFAELSARYTELEVSRSFDSRELAELGCKHEALMLEEQRISSLFQSEADASAHMEQSQLAERQAVFEYAELSARFTELEVSQRFDSQELAALGCKHEALQLEEQRVSSLNSKLTEANTELQESEAAATRSAKRELVTVKLERDTALRDMRDAVLSARRYEQEMMGSERQVHKEVTEFLESQVRNRDHSIVGLEETVTLQGQCIAALKTSLESSEATVCDLRAELHAIHQMTA